MLETAVLVKVVLKKRNFSAPGPERLVNFWWKRARCHEAIMQAFKAISEVNEASLLWFAKGKTQPIPKPGDFSSENKRPITSLNRSHVTSTLTQMT